VVDVTGLSQLPRRAIRWWLVSSFGVSAVTNQGQRQWWDDERWAEMWPRRERLTDAVIKFLLDTVNLEPGERACVWSSP